MGQLRDFFAAVGFCESTADLERKPDLIKQIVRNSLRYADKQDHYLASYPYESRLELALSQASTYALSRLIEEKVIVCMDQRLSRLDSGFWDDDIYSVFYNHGKQKVLSLYDNGKSYEDTGLFETGIVDHSDSAIDELITDYLDENHTPEMILGRTYYSAATKTTQFEWESTDYFESELRKNPDLLQPPLKAPPLNGPELYMNP